MNTQTKLFLILSLFASPSAFAEDCRIRAYGKEAVCDKGRIHKLDAKGRGDYACQAYYYFPNALSTFVFGSRATSVGQFRQTVSHGAMQEVIRMKPEEKKQALLNASSALLTTITEIAHRHCEEAARAKKAYFDPRRCEAACNGVRL